MQAPDLRGTIAAILSCDPYSEDFYDIESSIADLSPVDVARLLAMCSDALHHSDTAKVESTRVSGAKVLVALLPQSRDAIETLLRGQSEHLYEVQFSLFCFLEQVPSYKRLQPSAELVLSMTTSYLREVRPDEAQAAWMAGDMIGDHWPNVDEAAAALLEAPASARYFEGKKGALHGLSQLLQRNDLDAETKAQLISALKSITRLDPESDINNIARRLVKKHEAT